MKDQATKLENIGIPPVTLSDISEDNIRVVEREGLSLLFSVEYLLPTLHLGLVMLNKNFTWLQKLYSWLQLYCIISVIFSKRLSRLR